MAFLRFILLSKIFFNEIPQRQIPEQNHIQPFMRVSVLWSSRGSGNLFMKGLESHVTFLITDGDTFDNVEISPILESFPKF